MRKGFKKIRVKEVWVSDTDILIIGNPGKHHDCDIMECPRNKHIILWGEIDTHDIEKACPRCGRWPIEDQDYLCVGCIDELAD